MDRNHELTNELKEVMFTNQAVSVATDTAKQLDSSKLITNDLSDMDIQKVNSGLLKGNEVKTRDITEAGNLATSRPCYIVAFKTASTLLCSCSSPTIIREATFQLT